MPTDYKVRIRPGMHHGAFKRYEGGDALVVSEDELRAFGDKFTDVEEIPDGTTQEVEEAAAQFTVEVNERVAAVLSHLEATLGEGAAADANPQDIAALQERMANGDVPKVREVIGKAVASRLEDRGLGDPVTIFYAEDGDITSIYGIGPGTLEKLRQVYGKAGG